MDNLLNFAKNEVEQGKKVALLTVTKTVGSSPSTVGQMIAVSETGGTSGTIGGGASEFNAINLALNSMKNGEKTFNFSYNHAEVGMTCGGEMEGFGNILGAETHLYIFGGGHIAQSLAKIAKIIGFMVTVIEDREEFQSEFSEMRYIVSDFHDFDKKITFSPNSYVVVCTRGHAKDTEALEFCLKFEHKYIGVIGSSKKVAILHQNLLKKYDTDRINKVFAPIGLDIASSKPSEIAVSILAEILLIKNNGTLNHKKIK